MIQRIETDADRHRLALRLQRQLVIEPHGEAVDGHLGGAVDVVKVRPTRERNVIMHQLPGEAIAAGEDQAQRREVRALLLLGEGNQRQVRGRHRIEHIDLVTHDHRQHAGDVGVVAHHADVGAKGQGEGDIAHGDVEGQFRGQQQALRN